MADNPACRTCIWWSESAPGLAVATRDANPIAEVGACERHPPIPVFVGNAVQSRFPSTHADRSCGEYEGVDDDGDGEEIMPPTAEVVPLRSAA